uniref:Thiosulfate sulfurtransferase, related n=1 Tax=Neospora caninum (strain Liverpool) TaxID=572307 RepID=F0JBB4_NEOCL|nr:Thiosulfate sulfurtransferase, related [Neospora caninum Liverpool]CEL71381.1 TPA: Thiosulfate sulfurtransferase, related [Neospora caninum Liverpool]
MKPPRSPAVCHALLGPAELAELLLRFGSSTAKAQIAGAKKGMHARAPPREIGQQNVETEACSTTCDLFLQLGVADEAAGCNSRDGRQDKTARTTRDSANCERSEETMGEQDRHLFLFDASWTDLPVFGGRNAAREFREGARLPHAVFFDVDACSDRDSPYPHMMPGATEFAVYLAWKAREARCRATHAKEQESHGSSGPKKEQDLEERETKNVDALGARERKGAISPGPTLDGSPGCSPEVDIDRDIFVVYDGVGVFSSPRVYFMLKAFGCSNVFVLDGGIKRWIAEGYPVERGLVSAVGFEAADAPAPAAPSRTASGDASVHGESRRAAETREETDRRAELEATPNAQEMVERARDACRAAVNVASLGDTEAAKRLSEKATAAAVASGQRRAEELPRVCLDSSCLVAYDAVARLAQTQGGHTPDAGEGKERGSENRSTAAAPEEVCTARVGAPLPGARQNAVCRLLVDARVAGRFRGEQPEPRGGIPSGHIPGSVNLPFPDVLEIFCEATESGTPHELSLSPFASSPAEKAFAWHVLKRGEKLRDALRPILSRVAENLFLDKENNERDGERDSEGTTRAQVIVMCGSGMTACILYVALVQAGVNPRALAVYDGSWAEYAERRLLEHHGEGISPRLSDDEAAAWKAKLLHARLAPTRKCDL